MLRNKKGFTLIEMLVVIAIIAVLVSIIIPIVGDSTSKARAAADAANLRSTLGSLNTVITMQGELETKVKDIDVPSSQYVKDCELHVLYTNPGFIEVYFVKGNSYYGLDFLSNIAKTGNTDVEVPGKPTTPGTWYIAGVGKVS